MAIKTKKSFIFVAVLSLGWAAAVGFGVDRLERYANIAGRAADFKPWPMGASLNSGLALAADRETLLILAHPECPCTKASLGELARLAAKVEGRAAIKIMFVGGTEPSTKTGPLFIAAREIPGVEISFDPSGEDAKRFGAWTSGQALLYAPNGDLLFAGGITASRGHQGDNTGESAIAELIFDKRTPASMTPVFGCKLGDG